MEKLSAKKNNWRLPSLSLRDISPRGRDKFGLRVNKAFLFEEGGAAQAVTEGAAREQACARDSLMRHVCGSLRLLGSPFGRAGICEEMTERANTQTSAP